MILEGLRRWERVAFLLLTVSAMAVVMTGVYWAVLDRAPPFQPMWVKVHTTRGELADTFKVGARILVERENCVHRDAFVNLTRELISVDRMYRYPLSGNDYFMQVGCTTTTYPLHIPEYVVPGEYIYQVTATYRNNPLFVGKVMLHVFRLMIVAKD